MKRKPTAKVATVHFTLRLPFRQPLITIFQKMTMLPYDPRVLLQEEYLRGQYRRENQQTASALAALQLHQQLTDARMRLLQNGVSSLPLDASSTGLGPLVSTPADYERALLSQAIQRATEPASNQLQLGLLEAMHYSQQEQSRLQGLAALATLSSTRSLARSESVRSVSTNSSRDPAANADEVRLRTAQTTPSTSFERVIPASAKPPVAAPSTTPRKRSHTDMSLSTKASKSPSVTSTTDAKTPSGVRNGDGWTQASPLFAMSPLPGSAAYPAYRAYQKKKGVLNRNGKKSSKWYAMLEQLKQYKSEHGDCIVPRGFAPNTKLASWVAEQR